MIPLVSIITLVYKNQNNLYKTIDSVLNQNYNNIQYIIADDHSNVINAKMVDNYINQNKKNNLKSYKIIVQGKNIGTVANLKSALDYAKGEYIFNLSCNDVFLMMM